MKIVPEERFPPEHPLKVSNRIDGDGFGNDLRSSPENLDDRIQSLAKLPQVVGMPDWPGHPFAVMGRAKAQSRFGKLFAEVFQEAVGHDALRVGDGVEPFGVFFREDRLNVIKGEGEVAATQIDQVVRLSP